MALRAALHGIGEAQSCSQTTRAGRHSPLIIESKKNCGLQYNIILQYSTLELEPEVPAGVTNQPECDYSVQYKNEK